MPALQIRRNSPTNDSALKRKPTKPDRTLPQAGYAKPSRRFRVPPWQLKAYQTRTKESKGKQLYNYAK